MQQTQKCIPDAHQRPVWLRPRLPLRCMQLWRRRGSKCFQRDVMESSQAKCCFSKREVELGGRTASTLSVDCFTTQQHETFSRRACRPLAVARSRFSSSRLSSALSLTTLRVRRMCLFLCILLEAVSQDCSPGSV